MYAADLYFLRSAVIHRSEYMIEMKRAIAFIMQSDLTLSYQLTVIEQLADFTVRIQIYIQSLWWCPLKT